MVLPEKGRKSRDEVMYRNDCIQHPGRSRSKGVSGQITIWWITWSVLPTFIYWMASITQTCHKSTAKMRKRAILKTTKARDEIALSTQRKWALRKSMIHPLNNWGQADLLLIAQGEGMTYWSKGFSSLIKAKAQIYSKPNTSQCHTALD